MFRIFLYPTLLLSSLFFIISVATADVSSRDAVGVRVFKNPEGLSAADWYRDQCKGVTKAFIKCGTPTPIMVDGYDGIRDGNTVYVNAANENEKDRKIYTNIYLLAVSEGASPGGLQVFDQILKNWKFPTSFCRLSQDDAAKLRRDVRRHASLTSLRRFLDSYKATQRCSFTRTQLCNATTPCSQGETCGNYLPNLASGTYIPEVSFSVWPSWQQTLGQALGSTLPVDGGRPYLLPDPQDSTKETWQMKHFIGCDSPYDRETCWDAKNATMACPLKAYVFAYRFSKDKQKTESYTLTTTYESGNIPESWVGEVHPKNWAGTICTAIPGSTFDSDNYNKPRVCDTCGNARVNIGEQCDGKEFLPGVTCLSGTRTCNQCAIECDAGVPLYKVTGSAWNTNIGWILMQPQKAGVGIDLQNHFTGFAWSTNVGWIDMSGASVLRGSGAVVGTATGNSVIGTILMNPTRGGVTIKPTGEFSGQAWSSQIGWIDFGTTSGNVATLWKP